MYKRQEQNLYPNLLEFENGQQDCDLHSNNYIYLEKLYCLSLLNLLQWRPIIYILSILPFCGDAELFMKNANDTGTERQQSIQLATLRDCRDD